MYCEHCGSQINDTAKYCKHCGKPVVSVNSQAELHPRQSQKECPTANSDVEPNDTSPLSNPEITESQTQTDTTQPSSSTDTPANTWVSWGYLLVLFFASSRVTGLLLAIVPTFAAYLPLKVMKNKIAAYTVSIATFFLTYLICVAVVQSVQATASATRSTPLRSTAAFDQGQQQPLPIQQQAAAVTSPAPSSQARPIEIEARTHTNAVLEKAPKFSDYFANEYSGSTAKLALTKDDMLFRTRLRYAHEEPINFAGEYSLALWGCGADCLMGAAISKKTGEIAWLPGSICCWNGDGDKVFYRHDSRLLVFGGRLNEGEEYGVHFYEIYGNEFHLVKTTLMEDPGFAP